VSTPDQPSSAPTVDRPVISVKGWLAALFVMAAVIGEAIAGSYTATQLPAWVHAVTPAAWPPLGRGLWWVAVTAAAISYRVAERRASVRRHPIIVLGSTLPFAIFALGAAAGAEWTAWH
jgi:hypothetical protein